MKGGDARSQVCGMGVSCLLGTNGGETEERQHGTGEGIATGGFHEFLLLYRVRRRGARQAQGCWLLLLLQLLILLQYYLLQQLQSAG